MIDRSMKRRIRERMMRTGESYSIARMNVLNAGQPVEPSPGQPAPEPDEDGDWDDIDIEEDALLDDGVEPGRLIDDDDLPPPDNPDDMVAGEGEQPPTDGSPRFQAFLDSLTLTHIDVKDGEDPDDRIIRAARRLGVLGRCFCGEPEVDGWALLEAAETHADMNGEEASDAQRDALLNLVVDSGVPDECPRHAGGFDD